MKPYSHVLETPIYNERQPFINEFIKDEVFLLIIYTFRKETIQKKESFPVTEIMLKMENVCE